MAPYQGWENYRVALFYCDNENEITTHITTDLGRSLGLWPVHKQNYHARVGSRWPEYRRLSDIVAAINESALRAASVRRADESGGHDSTHEPAAVCAIHRAGNEPLLAVGLLELRGTQSTSRCNFVAGCRRRNRAGAIMIMHPQQKARAVAQAEYALDGIAPKTTSVNPTLGSLINDAQNKTETLAKQLDDLTARLAPVLDSCTLEENKIGHPVPAMPPALDMADTLCRRLDYLSETLVDLQSRIRL